MAINKICQACKHEENDESKGICQLCAVIKNIIPGEKQFIKSMPTTFSNHFKPKQQTKLTEEQFDDWYKCNEDKWISSLKLGEMKPHKVAMKAKGIELGYIEPKKKSTKEYAEEYQQSLGEINYYTVEQFNRQKELYQLTISELESKLNER